MAGALTDLSHDVYALCLVTLSLGAATIALPLGLAIDVGAGFIAALSIVT
jgi:hypothetical protein